MVRTTPTTEGYMAPCNKLSAAKQVVTAQQAAAVKAENQPPIFQKHSQS